MAVNWFQAAEFKGRPIQLGCLQSFEAIALEAADVRTHFVDVRGTNIASSICTIPGIWEPADGTEIKLYDPERIATVNATHRLFDGSGFSVTVWLDDPMTRED
jgi:hypothetical protein